MEPAPPSPEPAPMAEEEAAAPRDPESSQALLRDFRNLTLNAAVQRPPAPSTGSRQPRGDGGEGDRGRGLGLAARRVRRRGVRTVLSVRRERMARMLTNARRFAQALRNEHLKGAQDEPRSTPFMCLCSFCVSHAWDPSENARIGTDDNTEAEP